MQTKSPPLATDTVVASLQHHYGLRVSHVAFLPIGADFNSFAYRVDTESGASYFLKLRRGAFDEVAVALPAFLQAHGVRRVLAAIPTTSQRLWASGHEFAWMLYPFLNGHNGFETHLSPAQWIELGETVKAVHSTPSPAASSWRVPREDYSPRLRKIVGDLDQQIETRADRDRIVEDLSAFWIVKRQDIRLIVERAERLAHRLRSQSHTSVLCHSDLHAGNVLSTKDGIVIVDWDNPILALKERDLMFVGGGVGEIWNTPAEEALFYQGYGVVEIDLVALSYYRYERIVADLVDYGVRIFDVTGIVGEREEDLRRLKSAFVPNGVVPIAHTTYHLLG